RDDRNVLYRCAPRAPTVFPYTTLFRSRHSSALHGRKGRFARVVSSLRIRQRSHDPEEPQHSEMENQKEHHRDKDGGVFAFFKDLDRKSTRLNSSHVKISYAVFCLKKKS